MTRVLVVEDDLAIRTALERTLSTSGHVVSVVESGLECVAQVLGGGLEVVLLDLGLPDVDGLVVIDLVRAVSAVPIIVITARDDDPTMVRALDAGADDYVVKPFGHQQLAARIRAVLRRGHDDASGAGAPLVVGELVIDERARTASLAGTPLELSRKEFDVLVALAERDGDVVSKRELLAAVWNERYGGSDRSLDVHLSLLRRKLGETASEPRYLLTVRGVGIRLVDPTATCR